MVNIVPQYPKVNRYVFVAIEKFGRKKSKEFGSLNVITIAHYDNEEEKIKNSITVPTSFLKILYNDDKDYKRCFFIPNKKNVKSKADLLSEYNVECSNLF